MMKLLGVKARLGMGYLENGANNDLKHPVPPENGNRNKHAVQTDHVNSSSPQFHCQAP